MSDQSVMERLAVLERSNRRLKVGLTVCGVALLGMAVIGAVPSMQLVTTENLRVVDTDGKVRAAIGSDKDGTFFFLNDPAGKMRTSIAAQKDGAYVAIKDADGKTRVMVVNDEGGPAVRLKDADGNNLAVVATDKDGSWLEVRDADGRSRVLSTLADAVTEPKKAEAAPQAQPPAAQPPNPQQSVPMPMGGPKRFD